MTPPPTPPPGDRPTLSTLALVKRAQDGDRDALEHLYARYLPRLRRWARGRLPGRARGAMDTEDVVQDAMTRTFARLGDLDARAGGFFQAYTRQAVLNAIRDRIRRAREQVPASVALERMAAPGPSPLEQAIGRETLDRYEAALAKLSEDERALVTARIELRLPWAEIAEDLDRPTAEAARLAFTRAAAKLAKEMGRGRAAE
jgi:RNA polymerase sigma-70 factor, ECF subfamily